jgi:hypothetical protein
VHIGFPRYNFNRSIALLAGFDVDVKNPEKDTIKSIRLTLGLGIRAAKRTIKSSGSMGGLTHENPPHPG